MLVEDTTAFVEQIEVSGESRRRRKLRRRIVEAEFKLLAAHHDVEVASRALGELEQMLAHGALDRPGEGRARLSERRAWSVQRDMKAVSKHLQAKREEAARRQQRLDRLQSEAAEDDTGRGHGTFRLHSADHCLGLSGRKFDRLSRAQLTQPLLVKAAGGRRWWWFLNRFWWDDEDLSARDIQAFVLRSDLERKQQSEALAAARAAVLRDVSLNQTGTGLPDDVQLAVWSRDLGRCVDCGSEEDLHFDEIVRGMRAHSETARNFELRCQTCGDLRAYNERRARVSNARVDALPYQRHVSL